MISMIYRRRRTVDGKIEMARLYRGRYRLEGDAKITEVPLHTADKRVAQQRLEQIIRERQMEQSGMLAPESLRKAAQSPLEEHLNGYIADLNALDRDDQYIHDLETRIRRLMKECPWTLFRDITSDSFQKWRVKTKRSPKTLNEYLSSMSSFINWMVKNERVTKNPLQHVEKIPSNGKQVRPRRALNDDEMARLLEVCGPRAVLYRTAVQTGIRRGEFRAMERNDIQIQGETASIKLRASTTKNRKQTVIALRPEVREAIASLLEQTPGRVTKVFAPLLPKMDKWRSDLKAAGIPYIDGEGRRADFHSLRYTLATNLAKAGIAPRVAMEIMRHSDMRLTMKTYTDTELLPLTDAVLKLPSFAKNERTSTQIGTQDLFRAGHDLSTADMKNMGISPLEIPINQQDRQQKDSSDQTGHNLERVRGTGFEPVTFRV